MIAGSQATVTLPDEGAPTTAPSLIAVSKVEKFRINPPPPRQQCLFCGHNSAESGAIWDRSGCMET